MKSKRANKKPEKTVLVPSNGETIFVRWCEPEEIMVSLVGAFRKSKLTDEVWGSFSEEEQMEATFGVIASSIDYLAQKDKVIFSKDQSVKFGKQVMDDAKGLDDSLGIDIVRQLTGNPGLMKRNIVRQICPTREDKLVLWASLMANSDYAEAFGSATPIHMAMQQAFA